MAPGAKRTTISAVSRRAVSVGAAVIALSLAFSPAARPGLITGVVNACPGQQLSQPFLPWLDIGSYTLAGDGGFESGAAGWRLSGGARVVSGNEPWHVRGASDGHSLYLPQGATAVSPATCVGLLHPTARFFSRSVGGSLRVEASVSVLGLSTSVPIGLVSPGTGFAPTLPLPLLANLGAPLSASGAGVVLTFTAVGGDIAIDDVYVDPFKVN
jgi:hypothetical protein